MITPTRSPVSFSCIHTLKIGFQIKAVLESSVVKFHLFAHQFTLKSISRNRDITQSKFTFLSFTKLRIEYSRTGNDLDQWCIAQKQGESGVYRAYWAFKLRVVIRNVERGKIRATRQGKRVLSLMKGQLMKGQSRWK